MADAPKRRSTRSSSRRLQPAGDTTRVPPPPPPPARQQQEDSIEQEPLLQQQHPAAATQGEEEPSEQQPLIPRASRINQEPENQHGTSNSPIDGLDDDGVAFPDSLPPVALPRAQNHSATLQEEEQQQNVPPLHMPPHHHEPLLVHGDQRPAWTLLVRSQVRRQAPPASQKKGAFGSSSNTPMWHSSSIVVKILVTSTMTEERLGRCIVQASCASSVLLPDDRPAAGLFRERDGLFVPLESILENYETYQEDIWSLDPDSCRIWSEDWSSYASTRLGDLFKMWGFVVALIVGFIVFLFLLDDIQDFYQVSTTFLWQLPWQLTQALIDVPLRELYRYGPSMVGWEGASLARICARITYHGDEAFWSRNLEECERIYNAKEEAVLRIARPLVYILLVYMGYQMIKTLMAIHAEKRRWKPDNDVEQTYQAFNVLIGQVARTLGKPPKNPYKNG